MGIINTSECEKCQYGSIKEKSKAIIKTYCSLKDDKCYYYGQAINCDDFKRRKDDEDD